MASPMTFFLNLLFLLSTALLVAVQARSRSDLCGISIHASDYPDVGSFVTTEGTFHVPQARYRTDDPPTLINHGVALCCGDDCSARLAAFITTWEWDTPGTISLPGFHFYPYFMVHMSHSVGMHLNTSDTVRIKLEILNQTKAQISYTKYLTPTVNETLKLTIDAVRGDNGAPILNVTTLFNDDYESRMIYDVRSPEYTRQTPTFCGDSAWWFASDNFGLDESHTILRGGFRFPSQFPPLLIGKHWLQTEQKKWFPHNFPLGGATRHWDMVRDYSHDGKGEHVACKVRGFLNTGMTLLYSQHPWED